MTSVCFKHRALALALASATVSLTLGFAQASPTDDWPTIAPADAGFAPDVTDKLDAAVGAGELPNLHAVVVVRGGKLVFERYYEGTDERLGRQLGIVTFRPEMKHDLRSVSKSIVSLLYGIALDAGKVPALDQPLVDQFPAYPDLAQDPKRRRMTVAHALSMMMGTEWNERLPYTDPRNSEIAMEWAADRYRFVLDRPMVDEPGTQWTYNGGATAVLARIIADGTDTALLPYARKMLFRPLGITDTEWRVGYDGEPMAASGLRMRPRDLAKVGQLVLNRGRWDGRQLIPAAWLEQSFTPRANIEDGLDYGYQWWLGRLRSNGQPWMGGFGNGGQRLFVAPSLDLVVVITAGNYNRRDLRRVPLAVIRDHVMPALRAE